MGKLSTGFVPLTAFDICILDPWDDYRALLTGTRSPDFPTRKALGLL